jgi:hypothetical protein
VTSCERLSCIEAKFEHIPDLLKADPIAASKPVAKPHKRARFALHSRHPPLAACLFAADAEPVA